jgi:dihydroorotate dehydrogenase (fumarate)
LPTEYLKLISQAKKAVNIPIIGSLNGFTTGGWIEYAKKIEGAGADALELNIYYLPTEIETTAQELENAHIDLVADIKKQINIPLAVKLSPYFTALPGFAKKLAKAGANGLVLFNRFLQPDLDIETLEVNPGVQLSTSSELRLPLRWVAILYGQIKADLALTSGVHTAEDMVKALMAGSSVVMVASELLAKGPARAASMLIELEAWMKNFDYESTAQMRGTMSMKNVREPAAFERANYMKALSSFDERMGP